MNEGLNKFAMVVGYITLALCILAIALFEAKMFGIWLYEIESRDAHIQASSLFEPPMVVKVYSESQNAYLYVKNCAILERTVETGQFICWVNVE